MAVTRNRFVRRYAVFTDQHGREYGATVEGDTGHPCSPIDFRHRTPSGNLPPWIPDAKYLQFDPLKQGQVTIDYESALADRRAALSHWEDLILKFAVAMFGEKAAAEVENPSPTLIALVGPKPPVPDLVEACQQGNKWALGFTDAMPKWAEPIMAIDHTAIKAKRAPKVYPDADEKPAKQKAG